MLDIIIHWRNLHDMCPRPLQIRLPYILLEVIGNKKSGRIIAPGVSRQQNEYIIAVVTDAAATEHCYADSLSYFL